MITLRDARNYREYSLDYVAKYCGVSIITLIEYEENCEEMPVSLAYKISKLFNISWDLMHMKNKTIA